MQCYSIAFSCVSEHVLAPEGGGGPAEGRKMFLELPKP